jgi:hypothetical protein
MIKIKRNLVYPHVKYRIDKYFVYRKNKWFKVWHIFILNFKFEFYLLDHK